MVASKSTVKPQQANLSAKLELSEWPVRNFLAGRKASMSGEKTFFFSGQRQRIVLQNRIFAYLPQRLNGFLDSNTAALSDSHPVFSSACSSAVDQLLQCTVLADLSWAASPPR